MRLHRPYGDEWFAWIFLVLLIVSFFYGIWDDWPPTMGDPRLCEAKDKEYLKETLEDYADAVLHSDRDLMREVAHYLNSSVEMGCLSLQDLEAEKQKIVELEAEKQKIELRCAESNAGNTGSGAAGIWGWIIDAYHWLTVGYEPPVRCISHKG